MNARSVHAEDLSCFPDRDDFSARRLGGRLVSRDIAIPPKAADSIGGEAFPCGGLAFLTIQDARDDFIGIQHGQPSQQRDRVFIRPWASLRPKTRYGDIQCGDGAAAPAQGQMRMLLGALQVQDNFLEKCA